MAMATQPTLSRARVMQIVRDLRAMRTTILAKGQAEYSPAGLMRTVNRLEDILFGLVAELGGGDALTAVHAAMAASITPDELRAYAAEQAAKKAAAVRGAYRALAPMPLPEVQDSDFSAFEAAQRCVGAMQ